MALTIETSKNTSHFRSISLPSRPHPLTAPVEDHLTRLKSSSEASSSSASVACRKLGGLRALFDCVDDWLQLPLTQQDLSVEDKRSCIEELLDGSLKLVDVCSDVRDFISQVKDNIQELQSSIRRQKGVGEASISRKKLSKVIIKYYENLKRMQKNKTPRQDDKQEYDISMLKEVEQISLGIFQSLLCFLSGKKVGSSSNGWSSLSKLLSNGQQSKKEENMEDLDVLESSIQEIEDELEGIFRHLVRTRVYLLNILNH